MGRRRIGGLDELRGAADVALAGEQLAGEGGGRDQRRGDLEGVAHEAERLFGIALGDFARHGGGEHGALAVGGGTIDDAPAGVALHGRERSRPVAVAGPIFQHGLAGPGQRRGLQRLLGVGMGGLGVVAAQRLDVEAAQPERPRLGVVQHLGEAPLRRGRVARHLGGLGLEQQHHGLALQVAVGFGGVAQGGGLIAGADRDEAVRQRRHAALAPARPGGARQQRGHPEDEEDQAPHDRHDGRGDQQRDGAHQRRGLDLPPAEGDQHGAGVVGHPDHAEREQHHDGEIDQHAYHGSPTFIGSVSCRGPGGGARKIGGPERPACRGTAPAPGSGTTPRRGKRRGGSSDPGAGPAAGPRVPRRPGLRPRRPSSSALGPAEGRDGAAHDVLGGTLGLDAAPGRGGPVARPVLAGLGQLVPGREGTRHVARRERGVDLRD